MKNAVVCTKCGTVGQPKTVTPGYLILEIILWCCWIIPGIIYSYWRHGARHKACKACGSREVIGVDTPVGKTLINGLSVKIMTR